MDKNSFIMYTEYAEEIAMLTDQEAGAFIKAVFAYESGQEPPELSGGAMLLFSIVKRRLDDNRKKYEATCRARRESGREGGIASGKARGKANGAKASHVSSAGTPPEADEANASFASPQPSKPEQNEHELELDLDLDTELDTEGQEIKGVCPEPHDVGSRPQAPMVISLPLNDGSEYAVTREQCREWAGLYPAVDVVQQLRNMRGWLSSNKPRRKTRRGILNFITGWLSREQNRGGSVPPGPRASPSEGARSYYISELEELASLRLPEKL